MTVIADDDRMTQLYLEVLEQERGFLDDDRRRIYPHWAHHSYAALVLEHASVARMAPLRTDLLVGHREEGLCYANCYDAIREFEGYTYVEGYAQGGVGFPVQHAWLENEQGDIVDPTWAQVFRPGARVFYCGVKFADTFVVSHVANTGYHSFFQADWMFDAQLLRRGLQMQGDVAVGMGPEPAPLSPKEDT